VGVQRWEYRVVSLRDGQYTSSLNDLGQEGWELVAVCQDAPPAAEPSEQPRRPGIPMPRAIGRLEDAASAIGRLSGGAEQTTPPDAGPTGLLWVLKRPLPD
jgi:hypothetical protein